MLVDDETIIANFCKVKVFREYYKTTLIGGSGPLTWQKIAFLLNHRDIIFVSVTEVPLNNPRSAIHGMLLRFSGAKENPHRIIIRGGLNDEQKNFVITKELSHLLTDSPESFCVNGADVIQGMNEQFVLECQGRLDSQAALYTQSEELASLTAIKLLYSYEERVRDCEKRQHPETYLSVKKIAMFHRIPANRVESALSRDRMTLCQSVWDRV